MLIEQYVSVSGPVKADGFWFKAWCSITSYEQTLNACFNCWLVYIHFNASLLLLLLYLYIVDLHPNCSMMFTSVAMKQHSSLSFWINVALCFVHTEELRKHSWSGIPREVRPVTWRLLSVSIYHYCTFHVRFGMFFKQTAVRWQESMWKRVKKRTEICCEMYEFTLFHDTCPNH